MFKRKIFANLIVGVTVHGFDSKNQEAILFDAVKNKQLRRKINIKFPTNCGVVAVGKYRLFIMGGSSSIELEKLKCTYEYSLVDQKVKKW